MTPEQALNLAKTVADLYAEATARILTLIAATAAKGMESPAWQQERLAELVILRRNTARIVAAMQQHGTSQVLTALEEAYRGGRLTPALTRPGMVAVPQRAVVTLAADTTRVLDSTGPRVLRWAEDVYRQVIAEAVGPTIVGVETRREAAARAMDRFAARGVTGFTDSAGRNWALDTYAEMATRTAAGTAYRVGKVDRFRESGVSLVVVSDSPEECEVCRPWEGMVLSLDGGEPTAAELGGAEFGGTVADAEAAGIGHPNCTHTYEAFTPGLTDTPTPEANPDGYQARQRQRELERRVRESKRRVAALKPLGKTPQLARAQQLLGARRTALLEHNTAFDRKQHVSDRRVQLTHR